MIIYIHILAFPSCSDIHYGSKYIGFDLLITHLLCFEFFHLVDIQGILNVSARRETFVPKQLLKRFVIGCGFKAFKFIHCADFQRLFLMGWHIPWNTFTFLDTEINHLFKVTIDFMIDTCGFH